MDTIQKIKENYYSLTKSEKKVGDYILSNSDKVIHDTMDDLKSILMIGDATIIRFCKKVGFSGFTDLKISLAKDHQQSRINLFDNYSLFEDIKDTLTKTHEYIEKEKIDEAVTLLKRAKNIIIIGKGQSGASAVDLERFLLSIGVYSKAIVDPDFQIQACSAIADGDLLIVFSLAGRTMEIIETLKMARSNGAKIIGITNYLNSPIAKLSDLVLQSAYNELISTSVPGRISQMYISGILVDEYEKKYQEENILNIRENSQRLILKGRIED